MANTYTQAYQDVGYVANPGEDIFPTTGPHLDVRVLKDGQYIDPGTIRSLLTHLKVGKDKKALWQQLGDQWKPSYTITSGYGKRDAPTKGASTYHLGYDFGIPGGTPLFWTGQGSFTPGRGYGSIKTADAQGTPYEIRLLHTVGGKKFDQPVAQAPQVPQQQPANAGKDTFIVIPSSFGAQKKDSTDFLSAYAQQLLSADTPQVQSMVNPAQLLMSAFNQTPNYLS